MREAYTPEMRQSVHRARRRAALDGAVRAAAAHLEEAILRNPLGYAALLWSRAGLPLPQALFIGPGAPDAAETWADDAVRLLDRAADRRRGMGDTMLDGIHVVLAALDDPGTWTSIRSQAAGVAPDSVIEKLMHLHRDHPPLAAREQIQEALRIQRERGGNLGDLLVELGHVRRKDILFASARRLGLLIVDLDALTVPPDVIARVPPPFAREWQAVPIAFRDGTLFVALADPHAIGIYDDLAANLACRVRGVVADPDAVCRALARYYGAASAPAPAPDPPVSGVRRLVLAALGVGATDLHLECDQARWTGRFRVDGDLRPMELPSGIRAIIEHLKALAGIDPHAPLPQLGWFTLDGPQGAVEIECSSLPTVAGESVVLILPPPPAQDGGEHPPASA